MFLLQSDGGRTPPFLWPDQRNLGEGSETRNRLHAERNGLGGLCGLIIMQQCRDVHAHMVWFFSVHLIASRLVMYYSYQLQLSSEQ